MEFIVLSSFIPVNFISIQPLFRWNPKGTFTKDIVNEFQYNRCFGGIGLVLASALPAFAFQYNRCFGGMFKKVIKIGVKDKISIQPLFRWN